MLLSREDNVADRGNRSGDEIRLDDLAADLPLAPVLLDSEPFAITNPATPPPQRPLVTARCWMKSWIHA